MNKWLKIGTIAGAAVVGVAAIGIAAYSFLPMPAIAQGRIGPGAWDRGAAFGGPGFGGPGFDGPGFGMRGSEFGPDQFGGPEEDFIPEGFRGGPRGGFGSTIDHQALLAEALGITVEELEAAQQQARLAGIQQALDEGMISRNQADFMSAQIKLKDYLDRDELMAKALGITVEELQSARDEGKPMFELLDELGLDRASLRTAMTTAYEEAIQQAVTDGVITQDQADVVLSLPFGGFFGGPGGRGPGGRGPGGPGKHGGPGQGGPGGFGGFGGPGGFGHR